MNDVDETIREALACLPESLASRLGPVGFQVRASEEEVASRWRWGASGIEVEINPVETSPHDCALELLTCLGQALWDSASAEERRTWLELLGEELQEGVPGEIDERALEEKQALLANRVQAASPKRMKRYAEASFAGTVAEYVHSLWHDVTVRVGPDYLPSQWLRRRFALFSRWFPAAGGAGKDRSLFRCRARPPAS